MSAIVSAMQSIFSDPEETRILLMRLDAEAPLRKYEDGVSGIRKLAEWVASDPSERLKIKAMFEGFKTVRFKPKREVICNLFRIIRMSAHLW